MRERVALLKLKSRWYYLLADYLAVVLVWLLVMHYRNDVLFGHEAYGYYLFHLRWIQCVKYFLLIPLFWLSVFAVTGTYRNSIYEKSRSDEMLITFFQSLIGCFVLFFLVFLKDDEGAVYFFRIFLGYSALQFATVFLFRLLQLLKAKRQIAHGLYCIPTVFIGDFSTIAHLYNRTRKQCKNLGYRISGYISVEKGKTAEARTTLPLLGNVDELFSILEKYKTQQVIISLNESERNRMLVLINELSRKDISIKIVAEDTDILSGSVHTNDILSLPFISIDTRIMPSWQYDIKLAIDKIIVILSIFLFSPVILFVAIRTCFSTRGHIIYRQWRIGIHGRPFKMYKFRSMILNAETDVPLLSSKNDPRITSWGKIMRRWRLDELPQFWNVLKGDMSLIGPRPERQYFIDKISERNPYYKYLLSVRPGLTSWGMVQYGYASNVDEMLERMKYDLMYLENASLSVDFKIMLHTVKIVFMGKGK